MNSIDLINTFIEIEPLNSNQFFIAKETLTRIRTDRFQRWNTKTETYSVLLYPTKERSLLHCSFQTTIFIRWKAM